MKACIIGGRERESTAVAGWRRALEADSRSFEEICGLLAGGADQLPYDLLLIALSPFTVSWPEPLQRMLLGRPGVALVVWVQEGLPDSSAELLRYRRALAAADLVISGEFLHCREVEQKTSVRAVELTAPWLASPPKAFLGNAAARPSVKPRLVVMSQRVTTQARLLRELGPSAYAWTRLRFRIELRTDEAAPAELAHGDVVLLPDALNDGGKLAALCAEAGVLLLAPRAYHAGRFCFPFTSYGPESGRAGALLLWLYSAPAIAAFFREYAAHRARQLADGDRRLQLGRAIQHGKRQFACAASASRPSLLEEIRHVSGPTGIEYGREACVAVCLVRNGGEHIPSFLKHHRELGVQHFVFVDNGSDDGSRALLEQQADATVYESALPHKHYENELRRLIIERHCQGRWCLNVDIDELFDYPGSDRLPLEGLLRYLRRQGATAMVAYLLDMFARENVFGEARALDLKLEYPYYDLTDVEKVGYFAPEIANFCDQNQPSDPAIGCYFGGIRRRVFGGKERSQFLLTKHPLIFLDGALQPVVHPHYSNRARLADVTGVLCHYKLTPSFKAKVSESVASDRYIEFAQRQYDEYHRQVGPRSSLIIDTPGKRRLLGAEQLVEEGFLHASRAYRELALPKRHESGPMASTRSWEPGAQHG